MFWQDYIDQNKLEYSEYASKQLQQFKEQIKTIARCLADMGPFEIELSELPKLADRTVGYYSGAFGRFRQAKLLSHLYKYRRYHNRFINVRKYWNSYEYFEQRI